jgi:hypothetical protein
VQPGGHLIRPRRRAGLVSQNFEVLPAHARAAVDASWLLFSQCDDAESRGVVLSALRYLAKVYVRSFGRYPGRLVPREDTSAVKREASTLARATKKQLAAAKLATERQHAMTLIRLVGRPPAGETCTPASAQRSAVPESQAH